MHCSILGKRQQGLDFQSCSLIICHRHRHRHRHRHHRRHFRHGWIALSLPEWLVLYCQGWLALYRQGRMALKNQNKLAEIILIGIVLKDLKTQLGVFKFPILE